MNDHVLYRRFVLLAVFIATMGVLTASLIQETRPERRALAPTISELNDCGNFRLCAARIAPPFTFVG